tara:strand:+ start:261 stop:467 length:207 start_codon:yes stop_codon:yes gene_type:complete
MGPHEALKFIEEILLIKAAVMLIEPTDKPQMKIRNDLVDYLDTLLAEYNQVVTDFEEDMAEEQNRRLH